MTDLPDRLDAAIDDLLSGWEPPQDQELHELLTPGKLLLSTPVPVPTRRTARDRMNAALNAQRRRGLLGLGWLLGIRWPRPAQWIPAVAVTYRNP